MIRLLDIITGWRYRRQLRRRILALGATYGRWPLCCREPACCDHR